MNNFKELMDLYQKTTKHPTGILESSLQTKKSLIRTDIEEDKKKEIRSLMSRGVLSEKEHSRLLSGKRIRKDHGAVYHPAADYSKCYLSKAISNVMGRLTPRYKNEAARKEFFTRLAATSEVIHLNSSYDRMEALLENRDSDKIADTVLREVAALAKSTFDPNEELRQELATGRSELMELMSKVEDLTGVEWEESEKYDEHLTLVSFFDPWYVEDEKTERWGVVCYSKPTTLNIAPPVMFFDALRRSVIAREAINLFTPRIIDQVRDNEVRRLLYEQSEYLVTKLLRDKYEREFWLYARHGLREETKKDVIPGISDFFEYYESFVGDDLYRRVWSRLSEMTRLSLQLSSKQEYVRILDAIAARPVRVSLPRNEIAVFKILASRPDTPMNELARQIDYSIPTATKIVQTLTRKACLRFFIHVNDRTLGLEEVLFLIRTPKPDLLPAVLWRIPYCRDIYRLYGPMDYFVVVNVPEGRDRFVDELKSALVNRELASEITTVVSTGDFSNMSFNYYDSDELEWHVHWDSWAAGLAKELREGCDRRGSLVIQHKAERVGFDSLDLQIMEKLMYDCRKSYSEIAKTLGFSGAYISRKIHRLRRNNIFRPIVKPFKIGAEEYALVAVSCENLLVEPLVKLLDKLPAWRGAAVKGDFEGIVAQIGVPSGEVNQLFMVLDDRLVKTHLANCSFNVVGMWSSLRRWLPIDLYSKQEGWKFEESKYLALVERYGK